MKTHLDEEDVLIVSLGELIIVDWRGPVRLEAVDAVGAAIRSAPPGGVALFMIIREACGVPSPRVRERIKATIAAASDSIRAHATVIDGDGIIASMARTSINAMRAVIRKPYPERTFADVRAALDWLEAESPGRSWTSYDALARIDAAPSRSRRRA